MDDTKKVSEMDKIQDVKNAVHIQSDEDANGNQIPKGSTLFTKREWTMRYAAPFKALMFMAAPMVIIMLVNSLYGIIDKQLALNYAKKMVINMFSGVGDPKTWITGIMHNNWAGTIYSGDGAFDMDHFAEVLINVSTQYSNTIITLLSAMSLLTSVGTAIKWGQAMGERNKERMDSIVVMGLIQTLIMSGVGIILLHFVGPYIISSQADTPFSKRATSVIFELSNQYTQMYIYGFPLLAFATFISTMIRTEGKVWWVICINVSAICLNIGCGEAFLKASAPAQAMQSAVYGSFIAWGWMIVIGLGVILTSKNTLLMPNFKNIHLKLKDAGIIWLYGISPFVANFIFAVANYVTTLLITIAHTGSEVQNTIVVYWWNQDPGTGTDWHNHIHAIGAAFYITPALQSMSSAFPWMNILYAPLLGMMQGANANYAYCKGAGKRFRMIQIWRIHLMINMIWGVCVLIIVAAAGAPMMEAFGYSDPGVHRWWFFGYICGIVFGGMTYAALSLFQGTGDSFNATLVAILRSLVCNVGFVVIGWAIARVASNNGSGDWVIFIMNGLCEIPATIVGMIIVWRYFARLIKKYKVNDLPDDFAAPSLLTAAQNEVTIWQDSLSTKARKIYLNKISHLEKQIKNVELKQKWVWWDLRADTLRIQRSKKSAQEKKQLISKLTKEAKIKSAEYEKQRQILVKKYPAIKAKLDVDLENRLELLAYKADYKMAKATEKYRFRNQSLGNGTGDIQAKQLMEWKEAKDYDLLMSESLDFEQAQADIDKVYQKKLVELDKSKAKKLAYLKKIEDGDKVLNPFTLLFVGQEPQPLNREAEMISNEQKAKAMKKQKEKAKLRLHKRAKLVEHNIKRKKAKKVNKK